MIVNFVNVNRDGTAANPDATLLADENAAKAILESTFFNNITLTFNVGNGFNPLNGRNVVGSGAGGPNTNVFVTYGNLRTALLNSGQPTFFTDANLPAGNNIPITPGQPNNGSMSDFWISSSQARALGIAVANTPVDGSIGIGTTAAAGLDRVATILHEVGHAMGRMPNNAGQGGVTRYPELNLTRFLNVNGSRFIIEAGGGIFSIDGGATSLVNWDFNSAADFLDPANFRDPAPGRRLDPCNATSVNGNELGQLTAVDVQVMDALGFSSPVINAAPPAGTSGFMVLRGTVAPNNGTCVIYDLGTNALLGGGFLGRLGSDRDFVALGRFNDG